MKNKRMKSNIRDMSRDISATYDISEITKLLENGKVYIPKEVIQAEVYEESKVMFGSVFTECINNLTENDLSMDKSDLINKLRTMIKDTMAAKSFSEIWDEGCCYSPVKAEMVRTEVMELADSVDLSFCFVDKICE